MFPQSDIDGSALVLNPASLVLVTQNYSIFVEHLARFADPKMLFFTKGYICITHANGILQWREGIAYIFSMGGLSGILNQYTFIKLGILFTLLHPSFLLGFCFKCLFFFSHLHCHSFRYVFNLILHDKKKN